MILNIDHFTPLSRAVASIDRDAYAARFAVYDREHKALLRRLATAAAPVSDADVAREEQAFREAIRRIEFGNEDDQPTLVPADEPVEEAPYEPRLASLRPPPRSPRAETGDRLDAVERPAAPDVPGVSLDHFEPGIAGVPVIRLSEPRSLMRRVGERLAIAAVLLVLAGVGLWMSDDRRDGATVPPVARSVAESTEPAPAEDAAEAKAQQPNWLSPEIFYSPMLPVPSPPPASAAAPRADVPLPMPRPER